MNTFQIKWIAIITMVIDHVGLFFFPQFLQLRLIGRLAFPLFAWLIANGAYHTHDIKKYLLRLYLFALIAEIPFFMANRVIDPGFNELNVLCTLFLGLAAIYFIQRTKIIIWGPIALICIAAAQFLQTDYGGYGVAVVSCFYLFFNNYRKLVISQLVLFIIYFFFFEFTVVGILEMFGLASLVLIKFYNGEPGPKEKYFFYIFYPLQYVIYYFLLT